MAYIRGLHPELYAYEARARIKARWSPAVSIIAVDPPGNQTIEDIEVIAPGKSPLAPAVVSAMDGVLEPEAAELAALAHWSGSGSERPPPSGARRQITPAFAERRATLVACLDRITPRAPWLARFLCASKKASTAFAGRPVFDLSFYLQFRPNAVLFGDAVIEPLVYYPKPALGRKRVALVNPHSVLVALRRCSTTLHRHYVPTDSKPCCWLRNRATIGGSRNGVNRSATFTIWRARSPPSE